VDWLDVLALVLGVVIAGGLAFLVSPLAAQSDPDMVWEGRVAVGFAASLRRPIVAGSGGDDGVAGGSSGPHVNRSGAAVQEASNFAWSDTTAEPGWELRRTPPLPVTWPPTPDGSAVWFCYAERSVTPEATEVAGPWARIALADPTAVPAVERLSEAVESLGAQSISSAVRPVKLAGLHAAVRRGDPDGVLARALDQWRARNVLIAAHPNVTPHLPPTAEP
jgi:hypothetical protein